jgi:molybdenum cofactor cytidylyltransferase
MIGIVVLAAGAAKRFGACKLTLPIDGVPLVRRSLLAALGAAERVVVVSGAHRERVEACVSDLAIDRVFNANWADGMGASIACGISALATACDAAIIALADQVLIGTEQFKALIAAHARAPERIIAAQYNGVLGAPCLFPRAYFEKLAALHG